MSSSRLSNSPAKMGKTNAKPTLQNGGCRSRTTRSWFQVTMVTRAVHANSANLAGGHWRRKSFLTQGLINLFRSIYWWFVLKACVVSQLALETWATSTVVCPMTLMLAPFLWGVVNIAGFPAVPASTEKTRRSSRFTHVLPLSFWIPVPFSCPCVPPVSGRSVVRLVSFKPFLLLTFNQFFHALFLPFIVNSHKVGFDLR